MGLARDYSLPCHLDAWILRDREIQGKFKVGADLYFILKKTRGTPWGLLDVSLMSKEETQDKEREGTPWGLLNVSPVTKEETQDKEREGTPWGLLDVSPVTKEETHDKEREAAPPLCCPSLHCSPRFFSPTGCIFSYVVPCCDCVLTGRISLSADFLNDGATRVSFSFLFIARYCRNGEQDGGRVTQPRSVCSDQGNLPVLRQLSRGSEPSSAAALKGNNVAAL
ncbi:hypothetical protein NDU88_002365 [Pleurodeles waltl]|uniref:Uncharacterized protein n=1 Tax=Pleurodeles waltl TaxID=8319 RepID=A0AAV7NDK4_PLEWA|nr:hypothetical protein NDU88_002365 [Pleurodeles waltl]